MFHKYDPIMILRLRIRDVAQRHKPRSLARKRAIKNEIETMKADGIIDISNRLKFKLIELYSEDKDNYKL